MFNFPVPETNWSAVLPVILVIVAGIVGLIVEMAWPKRDNGRIIGVTLAGLALSAVSLYGLSGVESVDTFKGMIRLDGFGISMQLVMVLGTALVVLFSEPYLKEKRIAFGEIYPLMMWALAGGMLMASTRNLLMMFVGLEILSVSLYVLAGISRKEEKSEESAIKYFLLGAFASGFLLYGIAMIYGATGSLSLEFLDLAWTTGNGTMRTLLGFGLGLLIIGLGFKCSLVPFHQWTPDVYQGSPTNVTAFMATVGKVAAFAALTRLVDAAFASRGVWLPALTVIAVITMIYGNVVALRQTDVKRILAYSSIANAGYVLVGIISRGLNPTAVNPNTIFFYSLGYTLMTAGAFAVLTLGTKNGSESTDLKSLNGLYRRSPVVAISLIVFVASLIGLPPTAGFLGKALIFFDAIAVGQTGLAIVLAATSIISVADYLSIVRAAVVAEGGEESPSAIRLPVAAACVACAVGVVAVLVFYTPIAAMFTIK